jgi:hypothetical protein
VGGSMACSCCSRPRRRALGMQPSSSVNTSAKSAWHSSRPAGHPQTHAGRWAELRDHNAVSDCPPGTAGGLRTAAVGRTGARKDARSRSPFQPVKQVRLAQQHACSKSQTDSTSDWGKARQACVRDHMCRSAWHNSRYVSHSKQMHVALVLCIYSSVAMISRHRERQDEYSYTQRPP